MQFGLGMALLALFGLALAVGMFLALRWLFLWYWKVNEQVALLREVRDLLRAGHPVASGPVVLPAPRGESSDAGVPVEDPVVARLRRVVPTPAGG